MQCRKHILCSLNIVNINDKIEIHYSRLSLLLHHISLDINHLDTRIKCDADHSNVANTGTGHRRPGHQQPPSHIHYSCQLPLGGLLDGGTASLRRGEVGSWAHHTPQITDECGN